MGMIRFGALHFLSFFLVMAVASIEDDRRQKIRALPPEPPKSQAEQGVPPNGP
jgi:hypothetical protein